MFALGISLSGLVDAVDMSRPQDHFSMEQFLRSIFQETHSV